MHTSTAETLLECKTRPKCYQKHKLTKVHTTACGPSVEGKWFLSSKIQVFLVLLATETKLLLM
uniref:Uncharacterized protein n=1 Tax=Rhizophora mucronata TaxID=61149 RepID=A0A2P2J142_RHIMU